MFCAISGEVPQDPVVSRSSGHLFERRLVEKYIKETGKCPVTGKELSEDDLLPLQVNKSVKPRPVAATSIPGLLALFQNEWDEVVLETFTLKQHLDTTRQELSQALYQHDAACRVIARLMKERDEARAALSSLQAYASSAAAAPRVDNGAREADKMDVDTASSASGSVAQPVGLPATTVAKIDEKCAELCAHRKANKPTPEGPYSKDSVSSKSQLVASYTPHSASKGAIQSLALSPNAAHFLTGGVDKDAILSDRTSGAVVAKFTGHTKAVNSVAFHPSANSEFKFSGSSDKTVKVWRFAEEASSSESAAHVSAAATFEGHSSDVTSITVHPSGDYLVSASLDKSWTFWDVSRATPLCSARGDDEFNAAAFHPDGLILGTTSSGSSGGAAVRLWDVRQQVNVGSFGDHRGSVFAVSFSENGYLMATAGADETVRVWDLRKQKCTKVIEAQGVSAISFDASGLYLSYASQAAGGYGANTMLVKDWSSILELPNIHTKAITALSWGPRDSFLGTASADRVVRFHSSTA